MDTFDVSSLLWYTYPMEDTRFATSVHIMTALANTQDELLSSEVLSTSLKTNPAFVRKLISRLVEGGLIKSFRGKGGGIKLAKDAQDITLKEIYLASTENKRLICTSDKPKEKNCVISCSMGEIMGEVIGGMESASLTYLAKIPLSDLLVKIKKKAGKKS